MKYHLYKYLLSGLFFLFSLNAIQATCIADMQVEVTSDNIVVYNISSTSFDDYEWSVNGVVVSGEAMTATIPMPFEEGVYEICLYIADAVLDCNDEICYEVYLGAEENMCDFTDCIWPGDSNEDEKANIYDLLNIGYGYEVTGPSRNLATTDWVGQMATDWDLATTEGVNFKHLDANGDGIIDVYDAAIIVENYSPVLDMPSSIPIEAPKVSIDFDQESIIFDDNSPEEIEITATINLEFLEGLEIQSLAFTMNYAYDLVMPHSIELNTDDEATVFGTGNTGLIEVHRDLGVSGLGRYDFAIASIDGSNIPDLSTLATTKFIIIGDIIQGRTETEIDFPALIHSVRAMTTGGEEIILGENAAPAIFTIFDQTTTSTKEANISAEIGLYPNPARDNIVLDLGEHQAEVANIYNATGQLIATQTVNGRYITSEIKHLVAGVYFVKIRTDKGLAVKRFVKK